MATMRFWASPLVLIGLPLLTVGCAPAYRSYQCECGPIPYGYCSPAPLPYTRYCNCPTTVVSRDADWEMHKADPSETDAARSEPRP